MLTDLTNIRSTKVLHHVSCIMHHATSKQGRRLRFDMLTALTDIRSTKVLWFVEDDLQWKTIFGRRQPLVEDNLWWKMTFGGRQPSVEDDL